MKPKPSSSMQAPTASGVRSMQTPSASSTSAEPERLVAERLPCLATAQPAAAAISAAVVETLKVERPPPVPAVSTRSARVVFTGVANDRIVRARPAISPTLSPLVRSPMSRPAICVSDASPAMMIASTSAAWSSLRSRPDATASIALVSAEAGTRVRSLAWGATCGRDDLLRGGLGFGRRRLRERLLALASGDADRRVLAQVSEAADGEVGRVLAGAHLPAARLEEGDLQARPAP